MTEPLSREDLDRLAVKWNPQAGSDMEQLIAQARRALDLEKEREAASTHVGHPSWQEASREKILDALLFQGGTTKALLNETSEQAQRIAELEAAATEMEAQRDDAIAEHMEERRELLIGRWGGDGYRARIAELESRCINYEGQIHELDKECAQQAPEADVGEACSGCGGSGQEIIEHDICEDCGGTGEAQRGQKGGDNA